MGKQKNTTTKMSKEEKQAKMEAEWDQAAKHTIQEKPAVVSLKDLEGKTPEEIKQIKQQLLEQRKLRDSTQDEEDNYDLEPGEKILGEHKKQTQQAHRNQRIKKGHGFVLNHKYEEKGHSSKGSSTTADEESKQHSDNSKPRQKKDNCYMLRGEKVEREEKFTRKQLLEMERAEELKKMMEENKRYLGELQEEPEIETKKKTPQKKKLFVAEDSDEDVYP